MKPPFRTGKQLGIFIIAIGLFMAIFQYEQDLLQTLGGIACVIVGLIHLSMNLTFYEKGESQ